MFRAGPIIGGTRTDDDLRDSDQKAYCVHSNPEPFHSFRQNYQQIVDKYEEEFMQLSIEMVTFFDERRQPEEEFNRKMDFCRLLETVIQRHNPKWLFEVVPTGSSVTGLATKDSDLDVAIHIPQVNFLAPGHEDKVLWTRKMKLVILQIIRHILRNDEDIKSRIKPKIDLVAAQIQILKIETTDGIEVDISVSTEDFLSSMHNSHLIRHFAHIDSRFAPLCAVVKQWAASTEVKKPVDGGFNSYAIVLLVVHFLQCGTSPPILPHLAEIYKADTIIAESEHSFPLKVDFGAPLPRPLPEISRNQSPVAVLFFEFVHYYSKFNFQNTYISICKARVMNRRGTSEQKVRIQDSKEVYIEDPFDEHNPGRTCRTLHSIKDTFRRTMELFIPPNRAAPSNDQEEPVQENFKFPTLGDIIHMKSKATPEDVIAEELVGDEEEVDGEEEVEEEEHSESGEHHHQNLQNHHHHRHNRPSTSDGGVRESQFTDDMDDW